jgi:heat shock protein HslJ
MRIPFITAILILGFFGCGSRQESRPADSLAGTRWHLVEFQSMDDSIGTIRPADAELYTLAFDSEGLTMRLNCNRATGPWSVTPDAAGRSGSITIGPLAVTRALCPPPSMDERIARDMAFVRGYMLRDGLLSLSLMADAGIYLWEPQ